MTWEDKPPVRPVKDAADIDVYHSKVHYGHPPGPCLRILLSAPDPDVPVEDSNTTNTMPFPPPRHQDQRTAAMNDESDPLELARRLVYLAAERTLTSWIRTALGLMALGFVIDRFGLILEMIHAGSKALDPGSRMLSTWAGSLFIGLGAAMALVAGVRYLRFAIAFHRERRTGVRHGIYVGVAFSLLLALGGLALIILLAAIFK